MNGLANAILTMLLSWLRIIVNRVWSIINSDTGGRFLGFLAKNWPMILLVLGVGGFLLDKFIYLIRWRPFSVRRRQKQLAMEEDYQEQNPWPQQPVYDAYVRPQASVSPSVNSYPAQAPAQDAGMLFEQELPPQQYWDDPDYESIANDSAPAQTAIYKRHAVDHSAYRPPMEDIEPVFDEQALWAGGDALVNDSAYVQPNHHAPVSAQYQQDVNAGFARPLSPEQLYGKPQRNASAEAMPVEPTETQPVHPGLDAELFRRNMGLGYGEDRDAPVYAEEPLSVSFTPFTQQAEMEQPAKKNRNPFLNLMRLVGDDAAKPSIRDLQSNVDVREAFREPVYPKPLHRNEDDPS
ncbi:MAG: hypothetical protein J6K73_00320 [Clostridia bacterium]|nr:hypothetical protein [Clostridia bacterium]MBP3648207.1 hypothetical protein [Clostridia bacterium]